MRQWCCSLVFLVLPLAMHAFESTKDHRERELINHVTKSIDLAIQNTSNFDENGLSLKGRASLKICHLLNNLCTLAENVYFQLGVRNGAQCLAALFGNEGSVAQAVALDDWSDLDSEMAEFISGALSFIPTVPLRHYKIDFLSLEQKPLSERPISIYYYSPKQEAFSHEKAFTSFDESFDDVFIVVIDNWNWSSVRSGTFSAFHELGYKVLFRKVFTTDEFNLNTWGNGLMIAVVKKRGIYRGL